MLMIAAGAMMTMSDTSANSLRQTTAPKDALGQTVSLFMFATRGGQPLGALLTGLSIEAMGMRYALLLNGILAIPRQP
jgi:predicted MFS family arabinose efflux permease